MAFPPDQIDELERLFPGAVMYTDGGVELFLLPNVLLPSGCSPQQMDLLLCPSPRDGYPSRMFFAERVQAPMVQGLNWNGGGYIIERNWQAFSLKIEGADLRLAQLVKAHLRALTA